MRGMKAEENITHTGPTPSGRRLSASVYYTDGSSMTAQSIDRHDSYSNIAAIAQKDGLEDFALALRFAKD